MSTTRTEPGDEAGDEAGEKASEKAREERAIMANTAVMAAGTVVSRMSGFVRGALLAAALGVSVHADVFTIANTVPNMLYILVAGGVFNAVLVPQLVRSMRNDADGGAAYIDRVMTVAAIFLAVVTVLLVIAAPWVMRLMLDADYDTPALAEQRQSAIDFARFCLPQVFFYGMFVLVGQVLNARGRFGPMMWAPIANNVIAVAVLVAYLLVYGPATPAEQQGAYSSGQEVLLGIGSTVGIAAQLLILVPYLRAAGVRYRPRFDLRGTGLGQTFRLGVWTVLFVVVNQIAYVVVVRLASGGVAAGDDGTGITIYSNVMLVVMVPHSIITVSLATAILPRLSASAANGDLAALRRTLTGTLRTALVVVVPVAAVMPFVALPAAQVIWGHGATATTYPRFETPMILFAVGVVAFTVHYLVLRGFYALELNRTVFVIQCVIAATNIALAITFVAHVDPAHTASALVAAYALAYTVGAAVSGGLLLRTVRRGAAPERRRGEGVRWLVRLAVVAGVCAGAAALARVVAHDTVLELVDSPGWPWAAVEVAVVGAVAGGALLAGASAVRLREVTQVVAAVGARLGR